MRKKTWEIKIRLWNKIIILTNHNSFRFRPHDLMLLDALYFILVPRQNIIAVEFGVDGIIGKKHGNIYIYDRIKMGCCAGNIVSTVPVDMDYFLLCSTGIEKKYTSVITCEYLQPKITINASESDRFFVCIYKEVNNGEYDLEIYGGRDKEIASALTEYYRDLRFLAENLKLLNGKQT
jgi:hypothetical protein